MSKVLYRFRANAPAIHPANIRPGDTILVRPGAQTPILLLRRVPPNYGAILGLHEEGALTSLDLPAFDATDELVKLVNEYPTPLDPAARSLLRRLRSHR
jgi:hypothetical protein